MRARRHVTIARRRSRGLSLVELMVAITLGAILLGGAVTMFVNNRDTYNVTTDLSRLQETARFALDMMVRDIRMAGYFGCSDRLDAVTDNIATGGGVLWDPTFPIEGMEADDEAGGANTFQPSGFGVTVGSDGPNGEALTGRDGITIRYAAGSRLDNDASGTPDYDVTAPVPSGASAAVAIDDASNFAVDEVVAIADCGSTDIFQVTGLAGNTLTASTVSRAYDTTSNPTVAPYVGVRYYIGDNGRGPGGAVYPSLYRAVITDDGAGGLTETYEELLEGVETMQLLYGVDADADGAPDNYVAAGDAPLDVAANWSRVVSVRIGLLVRTIDEYGNDVDTATYPVIPNTVNFDPPDDRRRRRVFATTALVRNLQ